MYTFAYGLLMVALLCAIGGAAVALMNVVQRRSEGLWFIEKAQFAMTAALTVSSALLLHALYWHDFSLLYVANYTDKILPTFYRLTAFWAGQAGSLLFWALSVGVCGLLFSCTRSYKNLSPETRLWFWVFFLTIMAFFAALLTSWSNPFLQLSHPPDDGRGMNPLLQNVGMIVHPPLLFLGYGGFVIPGCLALAQGLSNTTEQEQSWIMIARPFTLLAWLFLTAGIVLGAWWAYLELGWGGYWAWDPVENASLIPWLIGTGAIHTCIVETRRGKLGRTNIFLMSLTTVSAFFATYLVRSGVIDSVHAFGDGGVGIPLLVFILASTLLCIWVSFFSPNSRKGLVGIDSREGFLLISMWVFIALAIIICIATLWPLISTLFSDDPQGLEASFYNRVCLPLFALLSFIMAFCPWLKWNCGVRNWIKLLIVAVTFLITSVIMLYITAPLIPVNLLLPNADDGQATTIIATASSAAGLVSIILLVAERWRGLQLSFIAAHGVHLGMILMVVGVAFSSTYKVEKSFIFSMTGTRTAELGDYAVSLVDFVEDNNSRYHFIEARLQITTKNSAGEDVLVGLLAPQRRIYVNFDRQQFAEASTIFSLGNEIYASLLGLDASQHLTIRVSVTPLVNWIWIGGVLACFFPFLGLGRTQRKPESEPSMAKA